MKSEKATAERVVPVSVLPVRREPTHRAERVTDWILGETLRILEDASGWLRTRGPDGYEGWVPAGPLTPGRGAAADWRSAATLRSLGSPLEGFGRAPWGARLAPAPDGRVELPDRRTLLPGEPGRIVPEGELARRRPAEPESILASAMEWLDAPYVWGGRTELGADCSGFVQAVYGVHGIRLPRDSHEQRELGADIDVERGDPPEPADLLFFAPEGHGITHVAIAAGAWRIVHAASGNGAVRVDDLDSGHGLGRLLRESIVACTRPLVRP